MKNIRQGSVVDDGTVYQACMCWPSKVRNKLGGYAQQGSTTSNERGGGRQMKLGWACASFQETFVTHHQDSNYIFKNSEKTADDSGLLLKEITYFCVTNELCWERRKLIGTCWRSFIRGGNRSREYMIRPSDDWGTEVLKHQPPGPVLGFFHDL